MVDGQRKEIALTVSKLSEPGMFAISQQWPQEGKWVIKLEAHNDAGMFTNALVPAGPNGVDRFHEKADMQAFGDSDVDSMLK